MVSAIGSVMAGGQYLPAFFLTAGSTWASVDTLGPSRDLSAALLRSACRDGISTSSKCWPVGLQTTDCRKIQTDRRHRRCEVSGL